MSLVGPRPALPSEVARFDDALLNRSKVKPGITGLWQVEARDNPAFSAYRRLDLFYVENWSVTLDLIILLATAEQVVARLVRILRRHKKSAETTVEAVAAGDATRRLRTTGRLKARAGAALRCSPARVGCASAVSRWRASCG